MTEKEDEKEDEEWISVESAKEIEVLKNKIDYLKGYIAGYKQGYYEAQIDTIGSDLLVNTEYEKGYAEGFEAGWKQCAKDGNDFESKGI